MGIKPKLILVIILLTPSLWGVSHAMISERTPETNKSDSRSNIAPSLYKPKFSALNVKEQMTLSPLFTPDNAIDLYVGWVRQANTTIELQNQYITQWDDSVTWDLDPSPLVRELVNAAGRGVNVRVQVRDDSDSDDITSYFQSVPNIDIRWMGNSLSEDGDEFGYLSATHNKMILIDDKVSLISSINFGENAFTNNREAGMVIQSATVTAHYKSIFEFDWSDGEVPPILNLKLSSVGSSFSIIHTQSVYPSHTTIPKANFSGIYNVTAFTNPDNADEVIFKYLENAKESIYVSMYTISRPDFNNTLIALKQANPSIDIKVLISNRRVSPGENEDTFAAAQSLVDNQIPVYNSTKDDDKVDGFYHNKYWIIDGKHTFIYSGNWSPRSATPQLTAGDPSYTSDEANRDMGIAVHDATDIASFVKTEVWDKDVAVADAWKLSVGITQRSFDEGDIVSGNVLLKAQTAGIDGSIVSYKFGNDNYIVTSTANNLFEVNFDTTSVPNGITTFHVKAEISGIIYTDSVIVNVVNYHSSENWRLLITEVLPDPIIVSDPEGEFIEITNSFPFSLLIGNWEITDDTSNFVFPDDTIIGPYSSLIIARDIAGFNNGYGEIADYEMSMALNQAGEGITLLNNKKQFVDGIAYGSGAVADGSEVVDTPDSGESIQRSPMHIDTNTKSDFIFASPVPKGVVPNVELKLPGESSTDDESPAFSYLILISSISAIISINKKRKK